MGTVVKNIAMSIAQTSHLFQTHTVRQRGTPDNPLFCATDVCRCLKIKNASQKVATINQDHVHVFPANGSRMVIWVNEAGLYVQVDFQLSQIAYRPRVPAMGVFRGLALH